MAEHMGFDHKAPVNGRAAAGDFGLRSGKVHVRDYLRVVYKHRWPSVTLLTLIMGLSVLYNLTVVPVYESKVQLLIDAGTENIVNFKEVVQQDKQMSEYYETQYRLLKSRSLARRTIDSMKAWNDPELVGSKKPPTALQKIAGTIFSPVTTVRGWIGAFRPAPVQTSAGPATDPQIKVIDEFIGRVTVTPVGQSRLVDAKFTAKDPAFATRAVNALADQYIQQARDQKFDASQDALDWLSEKLKEQQGQVQSSEQAAQQYRSQNDALASGDKENIVMQKLADLNSAVTRAKTARIAKEAQYQQLQSIRGQAATLDELPAVMANGFVQDLRKQLADLQRQKAQNAEKFGERHPEMVKINSAIATTETRLNAEIDKVMAGVQNEFEASAAEERNLTTALEAQKKEALALQGKAIDYGTLQRDASMNRDIFDSLMQRLKEAGIAGGLKSTDIRIVDRAEGPGALKTQARGNLIMSFLFGIMVSTGLAFFLEYLDSTVKSPEEIRDHLHLPFLGMLPMFPTKGEDSTLPILTKGPSGHFSEAFQMVRTNVLFSATGDGPKTLIVTSTQPNEGKSIVASNLAVAFGQIGLRVVLVDADMRRPSAHKAFGLTERGKGLSEALSGKLPLAKVVKPSGAANVWLVTAGSPTDNPAALLESAQFAQVLDELSREFEWVILDSPPVMPVTDAAIVASNVAGVLFVVGSEMTSRYAAMNALSQLDQAKAGFVGAVLNRVDVVKHSYYYSNYYKKRYASYYQEPIDPKPSSGVRIRITQ